MKPMIMKITIGIISAILLHFQLGFAHEEIPVKVPPFLASDANEQAVFPAAEEEEYTLHEEVTTFRPPFVGNSYVAFKEALGFKESSGDYFIVNTLGYMGKYQFGLGTLQVIGLSNANQFLNDPVLQEKAFHANMSRNKWLLRKDLQRFNGKTIAGIQITESGILAAAHLAGAGNVKKYLRSYGSWEFEDAYGTSIKDYLKRFSGYDVSEVTAVRNPRVSLS